MLLVKEAELRRRRDGGDYLRLTLGDRTGSVACMVWEELAELGELARAGDAVAVSGRYTVHPRFGPQINLRRLTPAEPGSYDPRDLRDGPARPVAQMEAEIAELVATVQQPHLRELLRRVLGPGSRALGALPRGARRQALPPGLPARTARAQSRRRAGGQRDQRDLRRRRPRRRRHRRAAARHRQARGVHDAHARDRPQRRRAPARRDRARLLPGPAPDRGHRRVPRGARTGGRPHHPLPSRLARARQPGGALHARGDARAHGRQPRRAARQLRPAREGAGARQPLVVVRPGDRLRRVLRAAPARPPRPAAPSREAA